MAQARRQENERRFSDLEASIGELRDEVRSVRRRVDEIDKCRVLLLEGFDKVEELWQETAAGQEKKWRELKSRLGCRVREDLEAHLEAQLGEQNVQGNLRTLEMALCPDVIKGVYDQTKWVEGEGRKRLPGVFKVVLVYGQEALSAMAVVGRDLGDRCRRASGLAVRGVLPEPVGAAAPALKRRLLYFQKTDTERERARGGGEAEQKGKGRNNGKKGKEKGKAKGKHKKGGQGKGGAQAAAGGKGGAPQAAEAGASPGAAAGVPAAGPH